MEIQRTNPPSHVSLMALQRSEDGDDVNKSSQTQMLISGLQHNSSSRKHRKNTSTSEVQLEISSPERSKQPQPTRPAAYTVQKRSRAALTYQLHLCSPSDSRGPRKDGGASQEQMSSQNIEERILSHLLLNFGILNFESTLRIRKIIEQKMLQKCSDPHVIFECSLGEFFQTMNELEIQQLA